MVAGICFGICRRRSYSFGFVDTAQTQHAILRLYETLRAMARSRLSGERIDHTLDPTGLANEAIIRMLQVDPSTIVDEKHFLAISAEALRRVLVDHARAKRAAKRGGGSKIASLEEATADVPEMIRLRVEPDEVLALNRAVESLECEDQEAATIVKLRGFAGLSADEVSQLLGVSKRTVERRWRYILATLRTRISGDADSGQTTDGSPIP